MKAVVAGIAFLVILLSGCSNSSNNNNPTNGGGNNTNYFFTATFREVNGPKTGSMNTSLVGSNPAIIYKDSTTILGQLKTTISANPNSTFKDSIQFSLSVPYPIQTKAYIDTPYANINVNINLKSNPYNLPLGFSETGGILTITSLTGTEAKGTFNLYGFRSTYDSISITGSFDAPYAP